MSFAFRPPNWSTQKWVLFVRVFQVGLFAVPLATIVAVGQKSKQNDDGNSARKNLRLLQIFGIAFLLPLLLVVASSTALFDGNAPNEAVSRLHFRYYNFLFPLFAILAAAQSKSTGRDQVDSRIAWLATLALAPLALYATMTGLKHYTQNFVDRPELAFRSNAAANLIVGIFGLSELVLWAIDRKRAASLYLLLFWPLVMLASAYYVNKDLRGQIVANRYDEAGQFSHRYLEVLPQA